MGNDGINIKEARGGKYSQKPFNKEKLVLISCVALVAMSFIQCANRQMDQSTDNAKESVITAEKVDHDSAASAKDSTNQDVDEHMTICGSSPYDVYPEFPGGEEAMYKWVAEQLDSTNVAAKEDVSGRVTVEFLVSETGKIENVRVVRGRHPALDKEALRIVKSMPDWKPGEKYGKKISVTYILPITFKIPDE